MSWCSNRCVITRSTTASASAGPHMRTFRPVRNMYRSVPSEKLKSSSGNPVLTQNLHPCGVSGMQDKDTTRDLPCDHQEDTDSADTPVNIDVA